MRFVEMSLAMRLPGPKRDCVSQSTTARGDVNWTTACIVQGREVV